MKLYNKKILAALLAAEVCFAGCEPAMQPKEESQSTAYSIYCVNADMTKLVKSAYVPKEETKDVMIQEMLKKLNGQKPEGENLPLLPKGVTITTYEIHEKSISVDFSMDYHKMPADREVLVRAGVVRMLLQVPGIVYVKFKVGGQELQDSRGNVIGTMTNETFVEQSGKDVNSYRYTTLTLYFTNKEGDRLVPEKRSVYYNGNISLERVVLDQLLKGPRESGAYPVLPEEMKVLGVTMTDGICFVNVDRAFLDDALPIREQIPVYAVVNTLIDACNVEQVKISVDGESNLKFRETIRLNKFYEKEKKLIQKPMQQTLEAVEEPLLTATPMQGYAPAE